MKQRRGPERSGAAMVEGVVVISTMLVFLGAITYARQAWGQKLDLQQQTRSTTLYYASHGCTGDPSGGGGGNGAAAGSEAGGGINPGGGSFGGGGASGSWGPSDGAQAASATRSWNNAATTDSRQISVDAIFDTNADGTNRSMKMGKHALTSTVTGDSNCTCNEPKYDSQLTAWFKFGKDMLQRGGGVADLFK